MNFLNRFWPGTPLRDYRDEELAFHLRVYQDYPQAEWSATLLRKTFPHARIFVISDGDPNPAFAALAKKIDADFELGQRLYTSGTGGQLVHRMLQIFFKDPRAWLIKIDPDTGVHRRPKGLPTRAGFFGSRQSSYGRKGIQGGFVGMTRATAQTLLEQRAFLQPELLDPEQSYVKKMPRQIEYLRKRGISEDWLLAYVAEQQKLPCYDFSEVKCQWQARVENPHQRFAFTHPCKDLRL